VGARRPRCGRGGAVSADRAPNVNGEGLGDPVLAAALASAVDPAAPPSGTGCAECDEAGGWWVHLRRCATCGHVGCCDSSPAQHATAHFQETSHPVIRSFEPAESWFWCYLDDAGFEMPGAPDAPSHS